MVSSMLAWLTDGSAAPGVQCGSGSENNPERRAWHEPGAGWGWTVWASAVRAATGSECGVVVPAPTGFEDDVVPPTDVTPHPATSTPRASKTPSGGTYPND